MVPSAAPGLPVLVLGGSSLLPTGILKWEGGKRGVQAEETSIKSVTPAPKDRYEELSPKVSSLGLQK